MSTIIIEDRLEEIFSELTPVKGIGTDIDFPIIFDFGTQKDLLAFLKLRKNNYSPYPLIWLETPYIESHGMKEVDVSGMKLVIATRTSKTHTPKQRKETTFKELLVPVFNQVKDAIRLSNTTSNDQKYTVTKFYNYGENNENIVDDIWDALKIEFDITINDRCFKILKKNGSNVLDSGMNIPL